MLEEFWSQYTAYTASGAKARKTIPVPGGTVELYFSMSTVRASFKPEIPPSWNEEQWRHVVEALAAKHQLITDFRDESYVVYDQDGLYYGRMRLGEVLFTPERLGDRKELLQEIVQLYGNAAS